MKAKMQDKLINYLWTTALGLLFAVMSFHMLSSF